MGLLTFSDALELLKQGKRVAREGWNGKGMWLRIQNPATEKNRRYIEMKDAQDMFVPWLASPTDMLAEDWVEV